MNIGIRFFYIIKINYKFLLFRLKCTFSNKPPSVIPINQSIEPIPIRPPISSDPSIIEMQKIVNNILFFFNNLI